MVNLRKAVLPKLWSVLRDGGRGCASTTFHNLLPLLSRLPVEPNGHHTLYQHFLRNIYTGLVCINLLPHCNDWPTLFNSVLGRMSQKST